MLSIAVAHALVCKLCHRYRILLFEMLTGDLPYYHKNKRKMIESIKIAKKPKFPKFANLAICSSLAVQSKKHSLASFE